MAEGAGWADVAQSVAQGVAGVASQVAGYGPNDQKKAVSAAKKAGTAAQKLEAKKWPNWNNNVKKGLAAERGISDKGSWKAAKAEACQQAYDQAYHEVWDMYVKAKDAEINNIEFQSSQEALELELAKTNAMIAGAQADSAVMKSAGGGCMGFALALVVAGAGSLSALIYGIIQLF